MRVCWRLVEDIYHRKYWRAEFLGRMRYCEYNPHAAMNLLRQIAEEVRVHPFEEVDAQVACAHS